MPNVLVKKKLIVVMLAVILPWLAEVAGVTWAGAPPTRAPMEPSQLNELQQGLLAELLKLDLGLQDTNARQDKLRREIEGIRREEEANRTQLDRSRRELEAKRVILARLLRFYYEGDRLSYLQVLLESEDMVDLLARLRLLGLLIRQHTDLLAEVEGLIEEGRLREERLAIKEAELQEKERSAGEAAENLRVLIREKEAALAAARAMEGGSRVLELEQHWSQALPSLHYLLSHFASLPWQEIPPDKVDLDFRTGGIRLEVGEDTLNRTLGAADPSLAGVTYRIVPQGVVVSGSSQAGGKEVPYRLTGRLTAAGPRLRLEPVELQVEEVTLGEGILASLFSGYDLSFGAPKEMESYGLSLSGVWTGEGKIFINLAPGRKGAGETAPVPLPLPF